MKKEKRALTLLEVMIVIFLITLITGAIGYSMKGSLDRGRAFRTEQATEQLKDLFLLCLEEGEKSEDIERYPKKCLDKYNLAKNSEKLLKDGWGNSFQIKYMKNRREFKVTSAAYDKYRRALDKEIPVEEDEE